MEKMLQLFLIWENGRKHEEKILNDISAKYEILQIFDIKWPQTEFANNLSRFYGKRLPSGGKKEKECGTGEFTLVLCYDNNPNMVNDERHSGMQSNANAIKDKYTYRQWTGGGYLVHASDNVNEVNDNLLILLSITAKEAENQYSKPWNGERIKISRNVMGAKGWKNEQELRKIVDKLSNVKLLAGPNKELIISTADFAYTSRLLNLKKRFNLFKKNQYMTVINGRNRNILLKAA